MFDILRKAFGGSPKPVNNDDSLGYSKEFIEKQIAEIRKKLIELHRISEDIKQNNGDPDFAIDSKVAKVVNAVGKVCDNLKLDREDYSKVGLTLESLNPLQEVMERLSKAALTGVALEGPRKAALTALEQVATTFKGLLEKGFQSDDEIVLRALVKTVELLK